MIGSSGDPSGSGAASLEVITNSVVFILYLSLKLFSLQQLPKCRSLKLSS